MPEKIVFILSTGRTGTKALAEGLANEETISPHQPPFSRALTVASNYAICGRLPKGVVERLIALIRGPQIAHAPCRYYIQAFALDHLPAKYFYERNPNFHVLHIVRDPRTFVPSYLNWIKTRKKSFIANRLVPGWHPSGYLTGEMPWKEWIRLKPYQKVCWQWVYKNRYLETAFQDKKRVARVSFEDLFSAEGPKVLKRALATAGIPYRDAYDRVFAARKNVSRKRACPAWPQWPETARRELIRICGNAMKRYGYLS